MGKRGPKPKPLSERFWKHTEVMPNGCVEWRASIGTNGYGSVLVGSRAEGRTMSAHRVAFALTHGPIPEGMLVCHTCDNRICVNPAHLWLGTHLDNNRDAMKKGRRPTKKPRTRVGRPFPPDRKRRVGSLSTSAKLTEADVVQARAEYAAGVRLRLIAKKYGLTYHGMRGVVLRLTWRHVVP